MRGKDGRMKREKEREEREHVRETGRQRGEAAWSERGWTEGWKEGTKHKLEILNERRSKGERGWCWPPSTLVVLQVEGLSRLLLQDVWLSLHRPHQAPAGSLHDGAGSLQNAIWSRQQGERLSREFPNILTVTE